MAESWCLARLVRIPIERSINDSFPMPGCCIKQFAHVSLDLLHAATHGMRPGGCPCSMLAAPAYWPRPRAGSVPVLGGEGAAALTRSLCIAGAPVPCCSWSGGCPCQTRTRRGWSAWTIGKASLTRPRHDRGGPGPPPLRAGSAARPWSGNVGGLASAKAGHRGGCPRPSTEEPLHGGMGEAHHLNF